MLRDALGIPKHIERKEHLFMDETNNRDFNRTFDKIVREVAYCRLKHNGFGGRERKIYTDIIEELKGCEYVVINKRQVKTGTYSPPSSGYNYMDGCPEYEPGYLLKQKTHVILEVCPVEYRTVQIGKKTGDEIEECNVEMVQRSFWDD